MVLRQTLLAEVNEAIAKAKSGDKDAALSYIGRLSNSERGYAVMRAYSEGWPIPVFREILAAVWDHDFSHLWGATRGFYQHEKYAELRKLFRHANFDLSHLPEKVVVWRGSLCSYDPNLNRHPWSMREGPAWSLDRGCACWFACNRSEANANFFPLVIKRKLRRDQVLGHLTDRSENEIIAFTRNLKNFEVDGTKIMLTDFRGFRPVVQVPDEIIKDWIESGERWHKTLSIQNDK